MTEFIYFVGVVVTGLGGLAVVVVLLCTSLDWVADRIVKTTGIYDAVITTIWQKAKDKRKRREAAEAAREGESND